MTDPRIYLAIDNCFASKRWTRPSQWMTLVRDLGLTYVEASADTECDPLYSGPEYLTKWMNWAPINEKSLQTFILQGF